MSGEALRSLETLFGDAIRAHREEQGALVIEIAPESLLRVMQGLRESRAIGFDRLVDCCAIDRQGAAPPETRFELVYQLADDGGARRLRVHCAVSGERDAGPPSLHELWPIAAWLEREVSEGFGIRFDGHPDPRPLLLTEGDGPAAAPLRRDAGNAGSGSGG